MKIIQDSECYEFQKVAKQSNGSVLLQDGDTVLLATVTCEFDKAVTEDFLPLTVQYIEKSYAVGKIPGGFIKREGKPGDFETLTSRIIDRSVRPLFPKGFAHPVNLCVLVLSVGEDADLQRLGVNAASAALFVSDLPIEVPLNAVRIGRNLSGEFIVNPNLKILQDGTLDLLVCGANEDILMIEMRSLFCENTQGANELSEEQMLQSLELAKRSIMSKSAKMQQDFQKISKRKIENFTIRHSLRDSFIEDFILKNYLKELEDIISHLSKTERMGLLNQFSQKILEEVTKIREDFSLEAVSESVLSVKRSLIRNQILEKHLRADGRGLKDVRPISIDTNILPKAHASILFTRGQTQALVVATLGSENDAQSFESLAQKGNHKERFMVHYNFPPFSVGEASPITSPGRRELGHGNLAKRALESSIMQPNSYVIRLVSEILESNGSSSMASVCGGSLALKAAEVECSSLVAGVAMGLICEGDKYAILTDIMGLEDHDGDMDFKVAGTKLGITALQMDIKLGGLSLEILSKALNQAKEARSKILDIMESVNITPSDALPRTLSFLVNPTKIVEIIGQGGKKIKEIIERFGVNIDLNRDSGEVKVSGTDKMQLERAREYILKIAGGSVHGGELLPLEETYKVGEIFRGVKVKRIVDFGAFVELPRGYDGLVHISKIGHGYIKKVEDVLHEGQQIDVVILSISKGKIELGFAEK